MKFVWDSERIEEERELPGLIYTRGPFNLKRGMIEQKWQFIRTVNYFYSFWTETEVVSTELITFRIRLVDWINILLYPGTAYLGPSADV